MIHRLLKFIERKKFFRTSFKEFQTLSKLNNRFDIKWTDKFPCLYDNTENTVFDFWYVNHLAWAARVIAKIKPEIHVDISSSLYFCTMLSAFFPVKFYDYRPAKLNLSNLDTEHADLTKLSFENNSIKSLSCMHVIEHIGLGRYGDPIDPDGDLKAISELKRVLAQGGSLLFVVPLGRPRIQFNAHRIYSYDQIIGYFSDFKLEEFALIPDNGDMEGIVYNAPRELVDTQSYGCGCFWFRKQD
ncbi:MAG: hypothetical protein ACD_20C00413G0012 [uncultured bacterium]|nr:MAG: hypothetical protein ACD_20C00413G0012 [uncultured bacterium]